MNRTYTRGLAMMPTLKMQPPIGIVITFGVDMLKENGGMLTFLRSFNFWLESGSYWMHKCKNRPKSDIAHVYIIVSGRIYGRVYYGGYETGETGCIRANGETDTISWPRIRLDGPLEKPPIRIAMRGFQGFRYVYEPMW